MITFTVKTLQSAQIGTKTHFTVNLVFDWYTIMWVYIKHIIKGETPIEAQVPVNSN